MNRQESLRKQISDMLGVEEHILKAVRRQRDDDRIKNNVTANKLVIEIERVLDRHVKALHRLADEYEADTQSMAKEAVTKVMGIAAGLYDKARSKHPLSRDLRDDYVALSLSAMAYTTMHTYGLTVQEPRVASLAKEHLEDLTPLLVEISETMPRVVMKEVAEESDFPTDTSVADEAVRNTQHAWSGEVTQRTPEPAQPQS